MAFRYRLCPDLSQSPGCEQHCADSRFVWNLALEQANCCRPSQAVFCCLGCGHADHADVNAAKNILAAGLAATARGGRPEVRAPNETRTNRQEAA